VVIEIDDGQVGVVSDGDAPLSGDPEDAVGPVAGEIDEALQGEPAGMDVVEHDGDECLHAGHAGRRIGIGLRLLLERVRRMV
jgi:hypothetical protein